MKKMLIDDTQPEETRVVIVDGNRVEDVEFESSSRKQIKGNVYTAKITRIEPSLQAAFVDYGGNRHGFLAFGEIHPDYYHVSDEVLAEVEAEVDAIIEKKRKFQLDRRAEQERRKLERAQKRADYEAMKQAELEAAANAAEEGETSANEASVAKAPAEKVGECACSADCACRKDDGECHCAENGVCECNEAGCSCRCGETKECCREAECECVAEVKEVEADEIILPLETNVAVESVEAEGAVETENVAVKEETVIEAENVAVKKETASESGEPVKEEANEETVVNAGDETVETETVETAAGEAGAEDGENNGDETADEDKPHRGRRRSTRFLGGRRNTKKFKVSSETAGVVKDEAVSEECNEDMADNDNEIADCSDEDDDEVKNSITSLQDDDDDDIETGGDDDDDDDDDLEAYLEVQRKLICARKLYYRSTIQDVIKEGQTVLIQIVKEERGNKGAACTTYLSLAGRYCVLMPNRIKSGGVSRKITSATDRKRLKEIVSELPMTTDMSLIVRTAGEDKKKSDIVRDYNYLIRTWNHIRYAALSTTAPAMIYEEGNLIKRALRDMCTKDVGEVIIDGEHAYRTAKEFSKILSPNMGRKIKCRKPNELPVFQHYQVEKELDKLHNPIVQLNSGGYLVINPTEALVAIDVNSGRATHEKDIEETALKTNLEAADEIAKQLRIRNLAGLIVVDFIDMEVSSNNHAVEKRMKEALKPDRARVQVAKMSMFGLLEISRQRMHSSFVESNYTSCPYCRGQGVIRTTESSGMLVLRALEEEGIRGSYNRLEVKVPVEVAVYLLNQKRRQLADLETKYGIEITVTGDCDIKSIFDYRLEKNRLPQVRNTPVMNAPAYVEDDDDETGDAADDDVDTVDNDDNEKGNRRYGRGRGRFNQRRRGNNGRGSRGRYNRERNNGEGGESSYMKEERNMPAAEETAAEPKAEKKTWWKKLIG